MRNGSGTYVLPAGQPVVTGTTVSSTVFNTLTTDLANALTTSVCTDGQTPMAANLPMGTKKITNMGNGTVSTDAAAYGQLTAGLTNVQTAIQAKNLLVNGAFRIIQRAQSASISTTPTAVSLDNWVSYASGAGAATFGRATASGGQFQYFARLGRTAADSSLIKLSMQQALETTMSIPAANRTVIFSFYALAGANFSSAGGLISVSLIGGTGTDQSNASLATSSWTGHTTILSTTQAISSSTTLYSYSAAVPSNITQLGVKIEYTTTGTAGADDNVYIAQAQLEVAINGQTAPSTFEILQFQQDLAICQRYSFVYNTTNAAAFGFGLLSSTSNGFHQIQHPVPMRTTPVFSVVTGAVGDLNLSDVISTVTAVTALVQGTSTTVSSTLTSTGTGAPYIAGRSCLFTGTATQVGLLFSAVL